METLNQFDEVSQYVVAKLREKHLLTLAAATAAEIADPNPRSGLCRELLFNGVTNRADTFDVVYDLVNDSDDEEERKRRGEIIDQITVQDASVMVEELANKVAAVRVMSKDELAKHIPPDLLDQIQEGISLIHNRSNTLRFLIKSEQINKKYSDDELRGFAGRSFPIRFTLEQYQKWNNLQLTLKYFLIGEDRDIFNIYLINQLRKLVDQHIEKYLNEAA